MKWNSAVVALLTLTSTLTTAGCTGLFAPGTPETTLQQTTVQYVTLATPYYTSTFTPPNRTTFQPATPVPEDLTCVLYSTNQAFAYTTKAFAFNVKNGPVYLNYTVSDYPTITRVRYVTSKTNPDTEEKVTYTIADPDAYFEITVRDRATGEIYLQDGFGKSYGYKDGTLKLMKQGDLLFELSGNKVRADFKLYAKPIGNIDDLSTFSYQDCIHWT